MAKRDPLDLRLQDASPLCEYPEGRLGATGEVTVVTWNLGKQTGGVVGDQLARMVEQHGAHVLALQEGRPGLVLPPGLGGHFARSFGGQGVVTAAVQAPVWARGLRSPGRELAMATPKAALLAVFDLGDGRELMVANVHALNFDRHGRRFTAQLRDLSAQVARHRGPLVMCGDFNTWNARRLEVLRGVAASLRLVEVDLEPGVGRRGHLTKVGNRLVGLDPELELDRVFHRELTLTEARWLPQHDASDHVPLLTRFRLEG